MQLDQRDPAAIEAIISNIDERYGHLDVLVNNAAWNIGIPFRSLDDLTADIWDRVMETNLRAPFLLGAQPPNYLKQAMVVTSSTSPRQVV